MFWLVISGAMNADLGVRSIRPRKSEATIAAAAITRITIRTDPMISLTAWSFFMRGYYQGDWTIRMYMNRTRSEPVHKS